MTITKDSTIDNRTAYWDGENDIQDLLAEKKHLQAIVDKQRESLKEIRDAFILMSEVAQKTLSPTATDKAHPILEELRVEIEIIKKSRKSYRDKENG